MAYTEIHPIKATLGKAIDYICNKAKTENGLWISSHNCQYPVSYTHLDVYKRQYLNGAQGIEIHSEYVSIDAAMLVPPPDFTGMNEINIPVMNPDLMRWMLLMAQMPKAETNDEELIYKLYYRFMSMEAVKAKFLVPMKLEENFPQSNKTEKIVLKSGAKFSIAVMKGKYDREAVIMYTDWKRLRECYNGWSGSIMTLSNIINNNDAVINPTNHPQLGFYIGKEMYEEMVTYTNK